MDQQDQILQRYKNIVANPWVFLCECVFTMDQVDKVTPVKRFPVHLPHLELYTRIWEKKLRLLVPKSRRMLMSWTNIALYLWDTMFHEGRFNSFVSKKEDDADELVKRAQFIYDHIPEEIIPRDLLPRYKDKFCSLEFPEIGSKIGGFPQGADQLRQFTFSGIFADEMAFWEYAENMYSASIPTLQGGGRFTGVSSPAPGFFKKLVTDKLTDEVSSPPQKFFPMRGVEIWENPKNKFTIFQLHYSADPDKQPDSAIMKDLKASMPKRKYMQEFELLWDSFEGKVVYDDWNENFHGSKLPLRPEIGLPLLRGWDFGLTPACIVGQLQGSQLVIFKEFIGDRGIKVFSKQVIQQCANLWPEWHNQDEDFRDFIDPAGFAKAQTDEVTCAQIMRSNGIRKVIGGEVTFTARKEAVDHFLVTRVNNQAALSIDIAGCPVFVRGFNGGYRYNPKVDEIEPNKPRPLKDEHSHVHDAFQYLASRMSGLSKKRKGSLRALGPQYSWQKREKTLPIPKSM